MAFPESRSRIELDQRIRERFTFIDPNEPCAMNNTDADYCGGPIRAEYLDSPLDGGLASDPNNIEVLCLHHSNRKSMHRYQQAFLHDREHKFGNPVHINRTTLTGGIPW